jgi:hypothetical protein
MVWTVARSPGHIHVLGSRADFNMSDLNIQAMALCKTAGVLDRQKDSYYQDGEYSFKEKVNLGICVWLWGIIVEVHVLCGTDDEERGKHVRKLRATSL